MSLIQDALKRKTEEQAPHPGALQPAVPPDVTTPVPDASQKKGPVFLSLAVILILLSIGIYLFSTQPRLTEEPAKPAEPETAAEQPEPPPAAAPAPVPTVQPSLKPEPVPTPEDKWPELSFSGSAVGGSQILAIINGRMLSVGDRISGATVLQIGRNEVLLEFEGEKRILNINDP